MVSSRPALGDMARALLLVPALTLAAGALNTARAEEAAAGRGGLRLVSINLARADPGAEARPAPAAKPSWRTTFGSERRTESKPSLKTGAIDADVVLLQGVTSVRAVRQLFPARDWRLVVSRQMLGADDPMDSWSREAVSPVPTTAVAVRYQEGVRVTGQEHLLELSSPAGDGVTRPRPAAGTALRIQFEARTLWVLSLDLTAESCGSKEPDCVEPAALQRWREKRQEAQEGAVLGGSLTSRQPTALPPPPCPRQSLLLIPAGGATPPQIQIGTLDESGSCLARTTLEAGG
jgi:hypothetical protein